MTKEFLESVLQVPSVSEGESMMKDFIKAWAKRNGCRFSTDGFGNVYITKGSAKWFPCLANHMDTVFSDQKDLIEAGRTKELVWKGDTITALNPLTGEKTGIGGDDLCGCAIAMSVMSRLRACKAIFTVQEELGCVGAKHVDRSFFDDVSFVIGSDSPELNRATRYSGRLKLCGDELFERYVKPVCAKHGVTNWRSEPFCDCREYRQLDFDGKRLDCVNLGNGAYRPHSPDEYVSFSDVCAAETIVVDLCETVPADRQWRSDEKFEQSSPYIRGGLPFWLRHRAMRTDRTCAAEMRFDSERKFEKCVTLLKRRGLDVKSSRRNGTATVIGKERDVKDSYVNIWNVLNGTDCAGWEDFRMGEPLDAGAFEDGLEFDGGTYDTIDV